MRTFLLHQTLLCSSLGLEVSPVFRPPRSQARVACPPSYVSALKRNTSECNELSAGWSLARSGGACLAILTLTGTERVASLNEIAKYLFLGDVTVSSLPAITTSSSGGSIFAARWSVLRSFKMTGKFVYPCYKLHSRFREVCTFHQAFGALADVCDYEFYTVFLQAWMNAHRQLLFTATFQLLVHLQYYYIYINTLPLKPKQQQHAAVFFDAFTQWQDHGPGTWGIGIDLVSPAEATPAAKYNYGFPAHLPRSYLSYQPMKFTEEDPHCVKFRGWKSPSRYGNRSVTELVSQSANILAVGILVPFSLNGNNWDATQASQDLGRLKVLGLTITFVVVKRLLNRGQLNLNPASYYGWNLCEAGCPLLDTGIIDNGPVATNAAYLSSMPECNMPSQIHVSSTASAFGLFNFYMGKGNLDIWAGGGNNLCPFADVSVCGVLTSFREAAKKLVSRETLAKYTELATAYAIWLPQNQFLASHCGDPIVFDTFKGMCEAKSYCHLTTTVLPSLKLQIRFTTTILSVVFSVLYLAPTALAKNFAHDFLPQRIFDLPSFRHIDDWFPAFSLDGAEKGGTAFFKAPGHALMDYLTFAVIRLTPSALEAKHIAKVLVSGGQVDCEFSTFSQVEDLSLPEQGFRRLSQNMR